MIVNGKFEFYESMSLDIAEFFQGLNNEVLKEKIVGIDVSLFVATDGDTMLKLGIDSPMLLSSPEKEQLQHHFLNNYDCPELRRKLIRQHEEQARKMKWRMFSRARKKRSHEKER